MPVRLTTWSKLVAVIAAVGLMLALGSTPSGAATHARKHHARKNKASGTVNIGVICSCSGPQASSFRVSDAAPLAWASALNAHGGLEGHHVNVIEKNDDSNPGTSLSEAQQLISQDHVAAIFDNTNVDEGWSPYVKSHKVPVFGISFPSQAMATNPYYFPVGLTEGYLDDEIVLGAKKAGAKNMAMFYCAEQAICAQEAQPLKAAGQKLGVPVVYTTAISASAPNYTAQCLAAKQAGAKALFIADAVTVNLSVASSCAQQGYKPVEVSDDGAVALSYRTTTAMQGMIAGEPDIPFFVHSTKATKAMRRAMRKYQPKALASPNYNEESTQAWLSGALFEKAVKKADKHSHRSITPASVVKGLYKLHGATLGGMAPPLTFSRKAPHTVSCWFWMRVQKDSFTTPYGLKPVCAPKT